MKEVKEEAYAIQDPLVRYKSFLGIAKAQTKANDENYSEMLKEAKKAAREIQDSQAQYEAFLQIAKREMKANDRNYSGTLGEAMRLSQRSNGLNLASGKRTL